MKKINSLFAGLFLTASIFLTQQAIAQAPQSMSYQSVIRNSSNALVANTAVGIKISVLQGNLDGIAVYTETQTATTNANGLLSLQIGTGSPTIGTFSQIDWANGPYFIKTETDPTGGSNYTIVGTQQLASVPYALYAAKSGGNAFETTAMDPTAIYNTNTGNVGIGTDLPSEKLDVAGNLKVRQNMTLNGTLNNMNVGNLGVGGDNVVFGNSAYNSGASGSNNTANGARALALNTTGSDNTANGKEALYSNATGIFNTANGGVSLYNNTIGNGNTANGLASLAGNTVGNYNTANGFQALLSNTTGSNNSAFGNSADVANGNLSNATAIGAGAIVDASNKIQLGNSAITSVYTSGTYTGAGFKTPNGTSSQFLMADGSVSTGAAGPQGVQGPAGPQGPAGSDATVSITSIANTSNANGGTINAGALSLAPADATNGGVVTTGAQTFAGNKTFTGTATANSFVKTGGTASQYLMANGSSSSIIRGTVAASGTVSNGTGFSGSIIQPGVYSITFNTPFTTIPIVVATLQPSYQVDFLYVTNITTTGFTVLTGLSGVAYFNATFNFIAMAP